MRSGYQLLLGGVRSGKSTTAERLAEVASTGAGVAFIATAEALDDEMSERISRHRTSRPVTWLTIEEPLDLLAAIDQAGDRYIIIDCVTLWVANLLGAGRGDDEILGAANRLTERLSGHLPGAVVVSNEVGMGVHPSTDLGRRYRDLLGAVNTVLARRACRSALLVAGQALILGDPLAVLLGPAAGEAQPTAVPAAGQNR